MMRHIESKPVLKTENLSVGYSKKRVLESVNLDFYSGEFVSLLGPNGVGKSTLLRTLSRLLPIQKGRVTVMEKSLDTIPTSELAKVMSVVLTHKAVPPLFQAYDFVAMGRYPHTRWTGRLDSGDDQAVMEALTMVRAQDLMFRDMATLSDGERQKILIARALAQEPEIILLDEPTMHLDLKHRMEIMSILKDMCRRKGICVVASLHDIEVASRVSDRVALIQNNTIARFGPPEDVLMEDTVSDLYDFCDVGFSRLLGNIEFRGNMEKGSVFVIGGMGSASVLYRLLSKKGYQVRTGVLFKNDVDYHVAKSLNISPLIEETLKPISGHSIHAAVNMLKDCDAVVDAGFETADLNMENLTLIDSANQLGKPVFRLNSIRKASAMRPEIPTDMTADTESALVSLIERKMAGTA